MTPPSQVLDHLSRLASRPIPLFYALPFSSPFLSVVFSHIQAGAVWVNCHNMFDAAAGFGGYKESGYGRDGGKEGIIVHVDFIDCSMVTVLTNLSFSHNRPRIETIQQPHLHIVVACC